MKPNPKPAKPPAQSRTTGVSRARAAAIARARVARRMIDCVVSDVIPLEASTYLTRPIPENCWYVLCSSYSGTQIGGSSTLVCICKTSGRVLLSSVIRSE